MAEDYVLIGDQLKLPRDMSYRHSHEQTSIFFGSRSVGHKRLLNKIENDEWADEVSIGEFLDIADEIFSNRLSVDPEIMYERTRKEIIKRKGE